MSILVDKMALVTGGSRGIGRAIAVQLASEGADVAFCYHRDDKSAEETRQAIEATGRRAFALKADLKTSEGADYVVNEAIAAFGRVDILVNNTGTTQTKLFLETTDDDFDMILATNLRSAFMVSRRAAMDMRKRRWGRIIHIGSIGGQRLVGGITAHYAASKAGMAGMTLAMAKELARYNILVNTVAPGLIETDLAQAFMTEKMMADFNTFHPLRRMGTPDEVASLVAWLASERASYMTGETLILSGGLS
jgi:3-oxoacyl-[acyl-carrier protein] reductase